MSNAGNKSIFAKNAVLFKDMSIDMKRPKILILMMIFNGLVFLTAGGFMIYIEAAGIGGENINYRALAIMLIVLIAEEACALFAVVPALTANTISGEKERQTLDVLLTTRMTPFEIVLGKYLSVLSLGIILVLSTFPFLALVFIYGGLNFLQLFGLVAVLILEVAYIAVFGVFFSSLTKKTVFAVILSYIILGALLGGTLAAFGIVYGIGELINEQIQRNFMYSAYGPGQNLVPEIHFDWAIFLLLLNPAVTMFDCIGSFLGVEIDDVTFQGMRTIVDMNYIDGKNILIILWTPISLILHAAIGFGLLRLAGYCLNPVKNTKKREREYERKAMKNIGVVADGAPVMAGAPMQNGAPAPASDPQMQATTQNAVPMPSAGAEMPAPQTMEPGVSPMTQQPVMSAPVTEQPAMSAPTTEQPAMSAPITEQPAMSAPVTEQPATGTPQGEATVQ